MGYTEKVVVVGAGISGLACAFRLKKLGIPSLVLEARDQAGGVIATLRKNGFLFETGPQFPRFPPSLWRLVLDLNLENEFVAGDPKAKRYILRHGRLHPAPFSPMGLIQTQLVGLKSKLRILGEPFGYSQPPDHEESLADFAARKFDEEVLDNLVDPFVSTIFLGDPHNMGMESAFPALVEWERSSGSLIRGAIRSRNAKRNSSGSHGSSAGSDGHRAAEANADEKGNSLRVTDALPALGSFRLGMATLPEKLSGQLRDAIRYRAQIQSVAPFASSNGTSSSGWQVGLSGGEQINAQHLVLAVPAHVAASLLESDIPHLATRLKAIEHAPISVVSSAYQRTQVTNTLDGFGFMVPRREGLRTICTFWNSSLFAERAPEGTVLLTSFARGNENDRPGEAAEQTSAATVEAENARILGIRGEPLDQVIWRDSRALPQYNVGHRRRVSEISDILRTLPHLHLAGNFLGGRSVGECVDVAYDLADDLHSQLQRQHI